MTLAETQDERRELYRQAEQSFERGAYSASVHDVYVHGYVDAALTERQKIAEEREERQP